MAKADEPVSYIPESEVSITLSGALHKHIKADKYAMTPGEPMEIEVMGILTDFHVETDFCRFSLKLTGLKVELADPEAKTMDDAIAYGKRVKS